MRVIAGKYRAKKLKEFDLDTTRPTLDRVKEALFSSIQFDCINATVLDLFAGTGALGIETISRGASKVYFVDQNKTAINIIKENLKNIVEDYEVCFTGYLSFLEKNKHLKFDIVLLDPPFNTNDGETAINFIIANNMLTDKGVIVYEKAKDKPFDKVYDSFSIKKKHYGTVELVFIRKEQL